ncbi:fibulin-5-like [Ptychodera flava]|uniref:fibulin-5-like n=1 Tax=Ptychodera flava TaxID=63121 RepID=UPI003969D7C8
MYRVEDVVTYSTSFECCDGWSESGDEHCSTPICEAVCENGGICSAPNTCTCPAGYHGRRCQQDVNECDHGNGGCDYQCHNTESSFYCTCAAGFILDSNGLTCSDHDECAVQHGCEHVCNNVHGSYFCSCNHGYSLEDNGLTCTDVDECTHENSNQCDHVCHNEIGSYSCTCRDGYATADDGKSCTPICDEGCANGGTCIRPGTCACLKGFDGDSCQYKLNFWTRRAASCECYFDHTRFDCACCVVGGCQCPSSRPHLCVQCGHGLNCGQINLIEDQNKIDGWTLSESGCPCYHGDESNNCACCQNGGCLCAGVNPHKCTQCGVTDGCVTETF